MRRTRPGSGPVSSLGRGCDRGDGDRRRSDHRFLQHLQAALVGLSPWRRREVFSVDGAVVLAHVPAALILVTSTTTVICRVRLSGGGGFGLIWKKQGKHH